MARNLTRETVQLLNRRKLARVWGCTPVEVEQWPAYEVALELRFLEIEAEAEKRRGKLPKGQR